MPSITAKKLCPKIVFLPVNMQKYRTTSEEIHKIYKCYTKIIEPVSLDEAYLDVTESKYCDGNPALMAQQIRNKIYSYDTNKFRSYEFLSLKYLKDFVWLKNYL